MDLRDRRVLITGASRGIGEAVVRRLVPTGARLALVARQAGPLEALARDVGAVAYPVDLSDPTQVRGLIARVEDDGPLDVLVNNAGIDNVGAFPTQTEDAVRQVFQVNLLSPVELCRQVLPGMIERRRGHIVNVSSMGGVIVFPGLATYAATKSALTHFTAGLRADLKGLPVGTTVVELGPIPTDMLSTIDGYAPTEKSFERCYKLRLVVNVPTEDVADGIVDAIIRGRKHVRLPRRAAPFAVLTELPRRTGELILSGVKPR